MTTLLRPIPVIGNNDWIMTLHDYVWITNAPAIMYMRMVCRVIVFCMLTARNGLKCQHMPWMGPFDIWAKNDETEQRTEGTTLQGVDEGSHFRTGCGYARPLDRGCDEDQQI